MARAVGAQLQIDVLGVHAHGGQEGDELDGLAVGGHLIAIVELTFPDGQDRRRLALQDHVSRPLEAHGDRVVGKLRAAQVAVEQDVAGVLRHAVHARPIGQQGAPEDQSLAVRIRVDALAVGGQDELAPVLSKVGAGEGGVLPVAHGIVVSFARIAEHPDGAVIGEDDGVPHHGEGHGLPLDLQAGLGPEDAVGHILPIIAVVQDAAAPFVQV